MRWALDHHRVHGIIKPTDIWSYSKEGSKWCIKEAKEYNLLVDLLDWWEDWNNRISIIDDYLCIEEYDDEVLDVCTYVNILWEEAFVRLVQLSKLSDYLFI
jgi:hypothetical protein